MGIDLRADVSDRRMMGGWTTVCTSELGPTVHVIAGEEISIACGELFGTPCGICMNGASGALEEGIVKGSSLACVWVGSSGTRIRRDGCPGLSSDEIDMEDPNERSRSFSCDPSRCSTLGEFCKSSSSHGSVGVGDDESMAGC